MNDVRDMIGPGPCEADICQRERQGGDRIIGRFDDLVRIEDKNYHRGCEPAAPAK